MPVLAVYGGIDVRATGKEHAVKLVVDAAQGVGILGQERDQPRAGAGARERLDVTLAHDPAGWEMSWKTAKALQTLHGDPEHRAFGHGKRMKTALDERWKRILRR